MWKMIAKLMAGWLTAFAIAGATVWAGADDDTAEPETAAEEGRAGLAASPGLRPDAAD